MRGNCLIAQSGGPTAVINNSLYGIVEQALQAELRGKILGAKRGVYGLLNGEYVDLGQIPREKLVRMRFTPGAALGTWRYKLSREDIVRIVEHMRSQEIRYFFFIGGNGSMRVAHMISQTAMELGYELFVIGIPKTVDNDLMYTDHAPGYGSAAKFLATCVLDISMDITSLLKNKRVTIIETMGRNAGWLAASCALAGLSGTTVPPLIYIPEEPFQMESFIKDVCAQNEQFGCSLVVVSEGIRDHSGKLLAEETLSQDMVGRPQLGGVSAYLAQRVKEETGLQARNVLPSIWQRSGMMFSSKTDVEEAYRAGCHAFHFVQREMSGVMVSLERVSNQPYAISYQHVPLELVADREKMFPLEWYNPHTRSVKEPFIEYVQPLIRGEVFVPMDNGLPVYQKILM